MEVIQNTSSLIFISANSYRCSPELDFEALLNQDSIQNPQKKPFFSNFNLSSLSIFKLSRQGSHKSKAKADRSLFSKNPRETFGKQEYRDLVSLRLLTEFEKIEIYFQWGELGISAIINFSTTNHIIDVIHCRKAKKAEW